MNMLEMLENASYDQEGDMNIRAEPTEEQEYRSTELVGVYIVHFVCTCLVAGVLRDGVRGRGVGGGGGAVFSNEESEPSRACTFIGCFRRRMNTSTRVHETTRVQTPSKQSSTRVFVLEGSICSLASNSRPRSQTG